MHTREHLRPDQLADILLLSKRTIYRSMEKGKLEKVLIRGNVWVKVPEEIKEMKPGDVLLLPSNAAKLLAVSRSTIYRWFWEGRLTGTLLLGRTLRIYKSGVDYLISEGEELAGNLGHGPVEDVDHPATDKRSTPKEDSKLASTIRSHLGVKR